LSSRQAALSAAIPKLSSSGVVPAVISRQAGDAQKEYCHNKKIFIPVWNNFTVHISNHQPFLIWSDKFYF